MQISSVSILRLPVASERLGDPRSTFYRKVKLGLITPPVKLSERSSGWPSHELDALVAARVAGLSEEEIKRLVAQLVQQRTEAGKRLTRSKSPAAAA